MRLPKWARITIRIVVILILVAGIFFGGAAGLYWWEFRDADKITVTVVNATTQPVTAISILDEPRPTDAKARVLDTLPDIAPGSKAKKTFHFKIDLGPAWLNAKQPDDHISTMLGILLTDNGPYEYTIVVHPHQLYVESWEASKGEWKGDRPFVDPQNRND